VNDLRHLIEKLGEERYMRKYAADTQPHHRHGKRDEAKTPPSDGLTNADILKKLLKGDPSGDDSQSMPRPFRPYSMAMGVRG
jgi:hypothetical protein